MTPLVAFLHGGELDRKQIVLTTGAAGYPTDILMTNTDGQRYLYRRAGPDTAHYDLVKRDKTSTDNEM